MLNNGGQNEVLFLITLTLALEACDVHFIPSI